MPIYKGSTEITSGNLYKGSTKIENGYKETNLFYVNTNTITINFVNSISGATMSTTQFSQTGTPGGAFTSFTRAISTDSGRVFSVNPTVSEVGDSGSNVSASIGSITSTSATLSVSGTFPANGTTITLTVSGSTQADLPNLVVTANGSNPNSPSFTISTQNGGALGSVSWSFSTSCPNGTSQSGSFNSSSSSQSVNVASYGSYPACGSSCSNSLSASASGYDSGSGSFSNSGSTPTLIPTCTVDPNNTFNYLYQFSHNPSRPTSSPDGCSYIKLSGGQGSIYNLSGFGVPATNCAGSWPSSWTDTLSATVSFERCTGATGTNFGNIQCTSTGVTGVGEINPVGAGAILFNA